MSALLRARGLTKRYGRVVALSDASFDLEPGELVAIVGPNGAGKTTLLSLIAGSQRPTAGEVLPADVRVGWAPQAPALYAKLSVAENLELFAHLERLEDPSIAVARMLEQTGLAERAREPVGRLSGGNRQRVNVALGLIADPPVLALDEPSASLDPAQRERLWEFVGARAAAGTAVLFSTHDIAEAQRVAGRILVLASGRLLFDGTPREFRQAAAAGHDEADLERALVRYLELLAPTAGAAA